ncbi:MAG TPA: HD domain-containing phosphohydrolase, partial [Crinalium sp.]
MECAEAKFRHLVEHPSYQATHHSEDACSHCQQLSTLDEKLTQAIAQLDRYWTLLVETNEPRILAEEPLDQLRELAQYTYQDIDGTLKPLISMEEMAQLMVPRGTLTLAERDAIQSHVTHTYEFLKRIPWTKQLQNVPAIAYAHHEKIDGSGYPLGLKQVDIPNQSQMMAIADIYDALTAGDRPYKRSLSVPTALKILRQEAAQSKLNSDLVELFEQRQIFAVLGHSAIEPK